MRKVYEQNPFRHQPNGGMYAKDVTARIAAFLTDMGEEAEVRVVEQKKYGSGISERKMASFGVYTSASEEAVEEAKEAEIFTDERGPVETARLWALKEWHADQYVQARRLFAAAGEREWSERALEKWEERSRRAFKKEMQFPSSAYDSFVEYGETYGSFYFGTDWPDEDVVGSLVEEREGAKEDSEDWMPEDREPEDREDERRKAEAGKQLSIF